LNELFWLGISENTRERIAVRLEIANPKHDPSEPWAADDVFEMGQRVLSSRTQALSARRANTTVAAPSVPQRTTATTHVATSELDTILDKMASLEVTDPQYAVQYTKLSVAAPQALSIWPKPVTRGKMAQTMVSNTPANTANQTASRNENCLFCGAERCRLRTCSVAADYVKRGLIVRHDDKSFRWPDGGWISLRQGSTLKAEIDAKLATSQAQASTPTSAAPVTTAYIEEVPDTMIFECLPVDSTSSALAFEQRKGKPAATAGISANANSGTPAPAFQYSSDAESKETVDRLYEQVLNGTCPLPLRTVLAISPDEKSKPRRLLLLLLRRMRWLLPRRCRILCLFERSTSS
jgi:hypothetical protein